MQTRCVSSCKAGGYVQSRLINETDAHIFQERDAAARAVKPECGIKREHERERSGTIAEDDDEISVIFTKRRREQYRTTVNKNGVELIDLT
jgi:hypothetical protein